MPTPLSLTKSLESKRLRALRATPLLLIVIAANLTFGTSLRLLTPHISASGTSLQLAPDASVPFTTTYFRVPILDDLISLFTAFFTPAIGNFDKLGQLQAFAFLGDLVPLLGIWLIEGERVGNKGTVASRFRTAFTLLAQLVGGAYVAPLYFFIQYVESDFQRYSTAETRRVEKLNLKTIFLTIVISYYLPTVLMFNFPGLENRQWINGVFFQPFPLYALAIQKLLQRLPPSKENDEEKRVKEKAAGITPLILAYLLCGGLAHGAYLFLWIKHTFQIREIFFSNLANPSAEHTMLYGAAKVLRYDQICMFSAGIIWTLLHFWDLKRAVFVTAPWIKIVGLFALMTVFCGPGAAIALMWAWRESVIRIELPSGKEKELESAARV